MVDLSLNGREAAHEKIIARRAILHRSPDDAAGLVVHRARSHLRL
jgi:hypothetical protein